MTAAEGMPEGMPREMKGFKADLDRYLRSRGMIRTQKSFNHHPEEFLRRELGVGSLDF